MNDMPREESVARSADAKSAKTRRAPRIRVLNMVAIAAAVVLLLVSVFVAGRLLDALVEADAAGENYTEAIEASSEFQVRSDLLTNEARMYVLTGDINHMRTFVDEVEVNDQRSKAVQTLQECAADDALAVAELESALRSSNELAQRELYAMKLASQAYGADDVPRLVADVTLDAADAAASANDMRDTARVMVLGNAYIAKKTEINEHVSKCLERLLADKEATQEHSNERMNTLVAVIQGVVALMLVALILVSVAIVKLVLLPLGHYIERIERGNDLRPEGAFELRYLAEAYNSMYEETTQRAEHLRHAAEHDPLTGLYNRGAYDALLAESDNNIALLLIDVDNFKSFNDTYGHDVGDAVLKKVAASIRHAFRQDDYPCRIGGDEFCVIMTDVDSSLRAVVATKIENMVASLRDTSDGVPQTTLSVGVAFGADHTAPDDLHRAADRALYLVKERGRNGFAFDGDE